MNVLRCKAKVKEYRIVYTYSYMDRLYEIETPRTALNVGVRDGDYVQLHLATMPVGDELSVEDIVVLPED